MSNSLDTEKKAVFTGSEFIFEQKLEPLNRYTSVTVWVHLLEIAIRIH